MPTINNLASVLVVALPAILNLGILIYILFYLPRGKIVNLFAAFILALLCWQSYDLIARLDIPLEYIQYVDQFLSLGWAATGSLLLHFILVFTGRDQWSPRQYFLFLYLPVFLAHTAYVSVPDPVEFIHYDFWGWVRTNLSYVDYLQRAVITIPVLTGLVLLFYSAFQNSDKKDVKLQTLLIATGILIPTIAGLYAQLIYPIMHGFEIPLTSTFMTFLSIAVIVSLKGYKLFSISESLNIEKTLQGLSGYVIIADLDNNIIFKNLQAKKCFNPAKHPDKSYQKLKDYFPDRDTYEEFVENVIRPTIQRKSINYFITKFSTHADNLVDVAISSELIMNNNVKQGVMIIATDITKRKDAERERKDILESIADGFFAVDREWTVTYWNRAAEEILAMPKEKIVGKNLWDEYDDAIPLKFYKEYHIAMETQQVRSFEEFYPAMKLWLQVSAFPKKDGLSVYFKNITHDKKQELEILRIKKNREAMINSTDELIWAVSKDYKLITANTPFYDMVHEMVGVRMHEGDNVIAEEFSEKLKADWKKMYDSAFEGESFTITHKTEFRGNEMYTLVSFNPIFNDHYECIGVACYSKDITVRMQYIKAMEEQNERLKSIAWTQSHVVRGPLSRLMGLINLIKQGEVKEEEMDEFLNYIKASANEIDEVIREIVEKSTEIQN